MKNSLSIFTQLAFFILTTMIFFAHSLLLFFSFREIEIIFYAYKVIYWCSLYLYIFIWIYLIADHRCSVIFLHSKKLTFKALLSRLSNLTFLSITKITPIIFKKNRTWKLRHTVEKNSFSPGNRLGMKIEIGSDFPV
jgi:hypothetical protein